MPFTDCECGERHFCAESFWRCPGCRHNWTHRFFNDPCRGNFSGSGFAFDTLTSVAEHQRIGLNGRTLESLTFGFFVFHSRGSELVSKVKTRKLSVLNAEVEDADVPELMRLLGFFEGVMAVDFSGNLLSAQGVRRLTDAVRMKFGGSTEVAFDWNPGSEVGRRRRDQTMRGFPLKSHDEQEFLCSCWPTSHEIPEKFSAKETKNVVGVLSRFVADAVHSCLTASDLSFQLQVFGSGLAGTFDEESDLDLTMLFRRRLTGLTAEQEQAVSATLVRSTGNRLKAKFGKSVEMVVSARVPLIRIRNKFGLKEVNLVFGEDLGMANSLLLREYATYSQTFLKLGLAVKAWAKTNDLIGPDRLSSYAWQLLVLFFLIARLGTVPNLQQLALVSQVQHEHLRGLRGQRFWGRSDLLDTRYVSAAWAKTNASVRPLCWDVDVVMFEFFKFYAFDFDWATQTVDIADPARALKWRFFTDSAVAILDPFEGPSRNLAKGLSSKSFLRIKEALLYEAGISYLEY